MAKRWGTFWQGEIKIEQSMEYLAATCAPCGKSLEVEYLGNLTMPQLHFECKHCRKRSILQLGVGWYGFPARALCRRWPSTKPFRRKRAA
jgi:DNA-directed RNA polymerase subunit RPC12/RpoP